MNSSLQAFSGIVGVLLSHQLEIAFSSLKLVAILPVDLRFLLRDNFSGTPFSSSRHSDLSSQLELLVFPVRRLKNLQLPCSFSCGNCALTKKQQLYIMTDRYEG